ncbi:F0F1 ATP synthase subunit delta [Abiotrophia defectiva]|uniref:F0F1 ATP synthase subunit delta n=1 Tax=Abiotrophia defectiva TaxID=46125 RepID=UPI0028D363B8|nr:F0F1 ATP synthase subunit delta [Abiotrophia defectiva]
MTEEVKQASVSLKRPHIADMEEAKKKREKTFEDKLLRKMQQEYLETYHGEVAQAAASNQAGESSDADQVRDENRTQYEDRLLDKLMAQISSGYENHDERRRQVRSETLMITSAVPLTEDEKEKMTRKFMEITKKPLRRITTVVDPSLITGVRLQSETFYYEVTGQKKLREIRAFLEKGWLQGDES